MPTYTWKVGRTVDRVDGKLNRTIVEEYYLLTDDSSYQSTDASLKFTTDYGIGITSPYDHPTVTDCYCSSIDADVVDDSRGNSGGAGWVFKVTVTYTNNWDSGGTGTNSSGGSAAGATAGQEQGKSPSERNTDPLQRSIDVKRSSSTRTINRKIDAAGNPVVNSVGDPFENAIDTSVGVTRYTISRNLLVSSAAPQFQGMTNNATVVIPVFNDAWAAHCLKLMSADSEPVYEKGVAYFRETYVLESGPNYDRLGNYLGWRVEKINQGYNRIEVVDGVSQKTRIKDPVSGYPSTEPGFLTSLGALIDTTSGAWTGSLHYITFQPDFTFNMAALWT